MLQLVMNFVEWLIIPLIIWFVTFMLERRAKRNKYEEMYNNIFAPLERIKKENAAIGDSEYILEVSEILFDKGKYGFVPVKLSDKFSQLKIEDADAIAEFERIIANNTNKLRRLQGMPHQYKDFRKDDIYVKGKSNVTLILTIVLMTLASAWIALLVMFPDFANAVEKLGDRIALFLLMFFFSFTLLSLLLGLVWGIGKAADMVGDSNGWKNKIKAILISIVAFAVVIVAAVLVMRGLGNEMNKYDSVTLERIDPSQVTSSIEDSSV